LTQGVAGDGRNLPRDQRGRTACWIDIGDANLAAVQPAALDEGGPLLELGRAGGNGDGLAFQILRRLDAGSGCY